MSSIVPLKRCVVCNQEKPASTEFFHRRSDRKDGLQPKCKVCALAAARVYGARPEVKERQRKYLQAYRSRPGMKEQYRRYHATYMSKPGAKERQRAYQRRFYSDPARRREWRSYLQAYWQRPGKREHHHAITKAYYDATKHQLRHQERARASNHTRRAHKRLVIGSYTPAQIQDQLRRQRYRCYYAACGYGRFPMVDGKYVYHIEHTYPLSRAAGTDIPANDISFIVLACEPCNMKKRDRLPHEWPAGGRLL